jgi:hypothetical protein
MRTFLCATLPLLVALTGSSAAAQARRPPGSTARRPPAAAPAPAAAAAKTDTADPYYAAFRRPPEQLRPFVRWWWNGARVNETEAQRELDVLKRAGVGGVEINTIAMPEYVPADSLAAFPERPWLSSDWCKVVKAAATGAKGRGMTADILVGSGWPFGGRFLSPTEQTKRVRLVKRDVAGPSVFEQSVDELARAGRPEQERTSVPPEVVFVRLDTPRADAFDPGRELLPGAVSDGRLRVEVPEGVHVLRVGLLETGFSQVKLGAPGADGPVVDHWNATAVRRYLDHMSHGLASAFDGVIGESAGGPLRAAFVDSLELDGANWTGDFAAEFARRRGYDLAPYLPFVLDPDEAKAQGARGDTVRRARYDFNRTLVELFRERFLDTVVGWANENGLLARMQAYGRETHVLDGSLVPDLPEGETWLWSDDDRIVVSPTVVNKYVSSGAHLAGHSPVSFEAMTNAVPVFRATLEDFKLGMDQSALAGVLQPVMHGFNYSPPEAGFPGWVRFGSWLNERNPWWPHFHRFTDYAARLTTALTGSEFQASVALLGPRADEWSRDGLLYQPFPEVQRPWYHYHLWQAFQQAGFGTDYVSEAILRWAKTDGGRLRYGTRSYDTLVLMDVVSLEPETAEAIAAFAEGGGRVVIAGEVPSRSPGLKDAAARDARVRAALARVLSAGPGRAARVESPAPGGPILGDVTRGTLPEHARRSLLQWVLVTAARAGLEPDVHVAAPDVDVTFVHHRAGDREVFFVANASRDRSADLSARFPVGGRRPWIWDLQTGERAPLAPAGSERLDLHLEPLESRLLVFEPPAAQPAPPPASGASPAGGEAAGLTGAEGVLPLHRGGDEKTVIASWSVTFVPPVGSPFERKMAELFDLSLAAGDPQVAGFGGTVTYRTEFDCGDDAFTLLSLGTVHGTATVRLNGRDLGTRWWGRPIYDARGTLHKGRNVLEIEVATMLGNFMRARENDAATKRWAWWFPPIPAGLVGPVELVKPAEPPPAHP